jgi:hypothetical protein
LDSDSPKDLSASAVVFGSLIDLRATLGAAKRLAAIADSLSFIFPRSESSGAGGRSGLGRVNPTAFTATNLTALQRLCEEFGFSEFAAKLSEFRRSIGFQEAEDADARERIAALEEKAKRHDRGIAVLRDKFKRLSTDFVRLAGEVCALRSAAAPSVPTPSPQPISLRSQISPLCSSRPSAPSVDSRIISDFPEIFAEFREKRFSLLWRGSRDSFKEKDFHRRCDGHANTLTVILDTEGNSFGGFTPAE